MRLAPWVGMHKHTRSILSVILFTAFAAGCSAGPDADAASADSASIGSGGGTPGATSAGAPGANNSATGSLDWNPGHYVLLANDSASTRDSLLASSTMRPFTGIQIKY